MKILQYSFILLLIIPNIIHAETINTGNSFVNTTVTTNANDGSVNSKVETNIESSGQSSVSVESHVESESKNNSTNSTYKKIEVNVNGEKKVIESREPGETKVEINTKTITPKPTITIKPSITSKPISVKPAGTSEKLGEEITQAVKEFISDLFSKIFK